MAGLTLFDPSTLAPLTLAADGAALLGPDGNRFALTDGVADLLGGAADDAAAGEGQAFYRDRAAEYDAGAAVIYAMLTCDEADARAEMLRDLPLGPGRRILEIGAGTCRDTRGLLASGAEIYAGDLSLPMLRIGAGRLRSAGADLSRVALFTADAMRLPFPDGYFDGAFHFGGLNLFPDIGKALTEMARVVRTGGRVVAGDEGIAPWLGDSQFAAILENSNPLFRHRAPLDRLPIAARDASCRWILGGAFYLLSFRIGDGEPPLDLDVRFPGWRGGSHRTRYFGKLDGVAPALRARVIARAAQDGLPVADWLETVLTKALGER